MNNQRILKLTEKYVARTYARFPVALVRGKGTRVWDANGKEYLDFVAGIAVVSLGHSHPAVVRAIERQARKLIHVSNLYHIAPQSELARELCRHSFANRVFFCNSGAEANEAAIKLARRYGGGRLGGKYEGLSVHNSFHGRTPATPTPPRPQKGPPGVGAGKAYSLPHWPRLRCCRKIPGSRTNGDRALEPALTAEQCGRDWRRG